MKSLTDFKRERLEEFRKRFVRGHGPISNGDNYPQESEAWVEADIEELEEFIWATIDLMNKHCIEVVAECIGEDDQEVYGLVAHEGAIFCNRLRAEMRLRAHTLLDQKEEK